MLILTAGTILEAKRPGTNFLRRARVVEDAVKGRDENVKVKFLGSADPVLLPWKAVKENRIEKKEPPVAPQSPVPTSPSKVVPLDKPEPVEAPDIVDLTVVEEIEEQEKSPEKPQTNNNIFPLPELTDTEEERETSPPPVAEVSRRAWLVAPTRTKLTTKKDSNLKKAPSRAQNSTTGNSQKSASQNHNKTASRPPNSFFLGEWIPVTEPTHLQKRNGNSLLGANLSSPHPKRIKLADSRGRQNAGYSPWRRHDTHSRQRSEYRTLYSDDEDVIEPNFPDDWDRNEDDLNTAFATDSFPNDDLSVIPIPRKSDSYGDGPSLGPRAGPKHRSGRHVYGASRRANSFHGRERVGDDHYSQDHLLSDSGLADGGRSRNYRNGRKFRRRPHQFGTALHDRRRLGSSSPFGRDIRISTSFKSTEKFPFHSKDDENNDGLDEELRDACADLVITDTEEISGIANNRQRPGGMETTVRRRRRRRKGTPRRWVHTDVSLSSDAKKSHDDKGSDAQKPKRNSAIHIIDEAVSGPADRDWSSIQRIFSCVCERSSCDEDESSIQCGLCGMWSHIECTNLLESELAIITNGRPKKRFMCIQCMSRTFGLHDQPVEINGIPDAWSIQIEPVLPDKTGLRISESAIPSHDRSRKASRASSSSRWKIRDPLEPDEIEARKNNFELLRMGLLGPSVGEREQVVVDSRTMRRSMERSKVHGESAKRN